MPVLASCSEGDLHGVGIRSRARGEHDRVQIVLPALCLIVELRAAGDLGGLRRIGLRTRTPAGGAHARRRTD